MIFLDLDDIQSKERKSEVNIPYMNITHSEGGKLLEFKRIWNRYDTENRESFEFMSNEESKLVCLVRLQLLVFSWYRRH